MATIELLIAEVLRVPEVVGGILQIGGSFLHRVLVETVETRLIDNIEDGLLGMGDGQRRVAGCCLAVGLHTDHRTEMDALLRVTRGVPRHRQLRGNGLHLVGHLGREGDATIDVAFHPDGDELVRMRGKIGTFYLLAVAQIAVSDDAAVEAETTLVVADGT